MSLSPVISVQNISKAYQLWDEPSARLTSPLLRQAASVMPGAAGRWLEQRAGKHRQEFWALRDVGFEVQRGEAVGIIGRNGSGKSTLLQIIAGTLRPTSGIVSVHGRVAALLELGSGFNPDFTGRENVYLNAAVLGLSRTEVDARFDGIAAFADIGDFIDQPIKTYSSGMLMRLAFSVQTAVDPDILIVDEALSVGDAAFVAKCINRVSDFLRAGGTLLFVSHDTGLVKQITTRALYLEQGRQLAYGDTVAVTLAYMEALTAKNSATPVADPDRYAAPHAAYRVQGATFAGPDGSPAELLAADAAAEIKVRLEAGAPAPSRLVYSIYNYLGIIVCSGVHDLPRPPGPERFLEVRLQLPRLRLAPGSYRVNLAVRHELEIVSWARNAIHFRIAGDTTETFIYREDIGFSCYFS